MQQRRVQAAEVRRTELPTCRPRSDFTPILIRIGHTSGTWLRYRTATGPPPWKPPVTSHRPSSCMPLQLTSSYHYLGDYYSVADAGNTLRVAVDILLTSSSSLYLLNCPRLVIRQNCATVRGADIPAQMPSIRPKASSASKGGSPGACSLSHDSCRRSRAGHASSPPLLAQWKRFWTRIPAPGDSVRRPVG